MSTYRSRIKDFIPKETLVNLSTICNNKFYTHANDKVEDVVDMLTSSGIEFIELGPGTHRFTILIDGYAFKIALDSNGIEDNWAEYVMSTELQPYVTKVYECNGLISVHEYVTLISREEFVNRREEILEIVKDIASEYLLGDIGAKTKSFYNWGMRDDGELVCLDFAYIFKIRGVELYCDFPDKKDDEYMCQGQLYYDNDYYDLVCEKCGRTHGFLSIRRRIVEKVGYQYLTNYIEKEGIRIDKPIYTIDDGVDNNTVGSRVRNMSPSELYDIAFDKEQSSIEKFMDDMLPDRLFKSKEEISSMTPEEYDDYRKEVEEHGKRWGWESLYSDDDPKYSNYEMESHLYESQLNSMPEIDYNINEAGLIYKVIPDTLYPGGYRYSQLLQFNDLGGPSMAENDSEMTIRSIHRAHLVDSEVYEPDNHFDLDFDRLQQVSEERSKGNMVDWKKFPLDRVVFVDWDKEEDSAYIRLVCEYRNIPIASVYEHPNYLRAIKEGLDYELIPKQANIDNIIFFTDYDVVLYRDPSKDYTPPKEDVVSIEEKYSGDEYEKDGKGNIYMISSSGEKIPMVLYGHELTDSDYFKYYTYGAEYFAPDSVIDLPETPSDKYTTPPEPVIDEKDNLLDPETIDVNFTEVESVDDVFDDLFDEEVQEDIQPEPEVEEVSNTETESDKSDIYNNSVENDNEPIEVVVIDTVDSTEKSREPINEHVADENSDVPETAEKTNTDNVEVLGEIEMNNDIINFHELTEPTLIFTNTDNTTIQNTPDEVLEWRGFEYKTNDSNSTDDSNIGIVHGTENKIVVICKEEQDKTIIEKLSVDNIRKYTSRPLEELEGILGDYINIPVEKHTPVESVKVDTQQPQSEDINDSLRQILRDSVNAKFIQPEQENETKK